MQAVLIRELRKSLRRGIRDYSTNAKPSLVLGAYEPQEKDGQLILSLAACQFNEGIDGKLEQILEVAGKKLKAGSSRVLYGLGGGYNAVAVANLGKQDAGFCALDQVEEGRENVRSAVASACRQLRDAGETMVEVDPCYDAEAAAEGGVLSLFSYDELKAEKKRRFPVTLTCHTQNDSYKNSAQSEAMEKAWKRGTILAEAQNLARRLMEAPSNKMTPSIFVEEVTQRLQGKCTIISRDKAWAESENMGAFLAVAQGSPEPLRFLEIDYSGGPSSLPPVALVGKGITFDTGGISIKPSGDMDKMRADMGGAACVAGAIMAAAKLRLPVNVKGFIALCENMPSGTAIKPGDVVTARSGKTIQVDNTDAEGRLILADTLSYAETCKPSLIMDMATLTGAVDVALGAGAAGAYTNCNVAWDLLHHSGASTGDRLWRMPLFKLYSNHVTDSQLADLNNIGKYARAAGSCTAAAFLKEFVTNKHWVHLDIAGVMMNRDEVPYLGKGMSGRPTRTIVEFLHRYGKHYHQMINNFK
ncbi:hypothetical protein V1264_014354 [Littorina saxatilis]|uniref:Cytosol aminopeptidase n=2 Tax=Littorina saxatilis TaxID=31220 RepID=A0AAN9GJP7_9CAEN